MFQDITFHGYTIPKGTTILMNLHSIHFDPAIFANPRKFQPDRFVNEKGEFDTSKSEKVIPFGYGKRKCVGKQNELI